MITLRTICTEEHIEIVEPAAIYGIFDDESGDGHVSAVFGSDADFCAREGCEKPIVQSWLLKNGVPVSTDEMM